MATTEHLSPRRSSVQPDLLLSAGRHVRIVDPTDTEDVCLGVIAMATGRTVRIRLVDAFPGDWMPGHTVRLEMLSDGTVWSAEVDITNVPDPPIWLECSRPHVIAGRDRRAHPRMACRLPVRVQRLRPNGVERSVAGRACDLGAGGMLLAGVELAVGDVVELDLLEDVVDLCATGPDEGLGEAGSVLTVRGLVVGARRDATDTHYAHIAFASLPEPAEDRLEHLLSELTPV
ncbi:MAG: PilZ domain-containing protein [Actinobacteria bacterium]|nr:PilZ domain-containing protein [Actinomycetota bacterium]